MARIMIIDDDIEMADNMAALLRDQGYEMSVLYTTEEAVRHVSEDKPDLVILDVMFPDNPAGGFDLARLMRGRSEFRELPIILLTSVNQEFPMDFSAADIDPDWMPVQDFLEKPTSPERLLASVRKSLSAT